MGIYEDLCEACDADRVLRQEPMSRHTTFRVGGPAKYLVQPDMDEVWDVVTACRMNEVPFTIVGHGSNLLVGDGGIDGVVIEIGREMSEIVVAGTMIRAEAGALLSTISSRAAEAGLTGLEFASGIPGSVGGAVFMNAGAYGGEMKDVLVSAEVLTKRGQIMTLPAEELDLSYRHSNIEEKEYIVTEVTLQLKKGDPDAIRQTMSELKEKRTSKQPLEYPSAGSTFKRPEGYFAGKLIQDAGLKGFSVGGAQVSEKHAGFVINRDHATASDVRSLIRQVQDKVEENSGVRLEPEVRMVGRFTED